MNVFTLFNILLNFLTGSVMVFSGLFIWRKFRDEFETRTIGGILLFTSPIFLLMAFRYLFFSIGLISETVSFYLFFFEYILILSLLLPFAFPRFLLLLTNRPVAKKIGSVLGFIFYLIFLIIHFSKREEIIAHPTIIGLSFELPYIEKIFLLGVFGFSFLIMGYRAITLFYQWRKKRTFPFKLLNYVCIFLMFFSSVPFLLPEVRKWQTSLGAVLTLASVLGIYLISSQELISKEET